MSRTGTKSITRRSLALLIACVCPTPSPCRGSLLPAPSIQGVFLPGICRFFSALLRRAGGTALSGSDGFLWKLRPPESSRTHQSAVWVRHPPFLGDRVLLTELSLCTKTQLIDCFINMSLCCTGGGGIPLGNSLGVIFASVVPHH